MASLVGGAWGWLRSWGGSQKALPPGQKQPTRGGWGVRGWADWAWGGWRGGKAQTGPVEEYWEAQEKLVPLGGSETRRWWSYLWPRDATRRGARTGEAEGDASDYGTPPPSPPPSPVSPFRLFTSGLQLEVGPQHYDICFNFLRHLFDLLAVSFLRAASPPVRLVLEALGVRGALRLWVHGMAMFLVSTAGVGGLLWLVQEYLPQAALVYGVVQALVISVSVRQSVVLGAAEDHDPEREAEDGHQAEGGGGGGGAKD